MKKSKRILSLLTALTITASAFASLAIPASAASETVYTMDLSAATSGRVTAKMAGNDKSTMAGTDVSVVKSQVTAPTAELIAACSVEDFGTGNSDATYGVPAVAALDGWGYHHFANSGLESGKDRESSASIDATNNAFYINGVGNADYDAAISFIPANANITLGSNIYYYTFDAVVTGGGNATRGIGNPRIGFTSAANGATITDVAHADVPSVESATTTYKMVLVYNKGTGGYSIYRDGVRRATGTSEQITGIYAQSTEKYTNVGVKDLVLTQEDAAPTEIDSVTFMDGAEEYTKYEHVIAGATIPAPADPTPATGKIFAGWKLQGEADVAATLTAGDTNTVYEAVYEDRTTITVDYENGVVDWNNGSDNRYESKIVEGDEGNHYLQITNVLNEEGIKDRNNGTNLATNTNYKTTFEAGQDFFMSFRFLLSGGNDQTSNFAVKDAAGGNILLLEQVSANGTVYSINGNAKQTVTLDKAKWYTAELVRYGANTFFAVKNSDGTVLMEQKLITQASKNGGVSGMTFHTGRYYATLNLDDVTIRSFKEGDAPDLKVYTLTVNSTRYAYMTYTLDGEDGGTAYGDVDGKIEVPNILEDTVVKYTVKKTGYYDSEGEVTMTEDKTESKPLTLLPSEGAADTIYVESDFGNAEGMFGLGAADRDATIKLGDVEVPDMTTVSIDWYVEKAERDQVTWFLKNKAGQIIVGLQGLNAPDDITPPSLTAFTKWASKDYNQYDSTFDTDNSMIINEGYVGDITVDFVIDNVNNIITITCGNTVESINLEEDVDPTTISTMEMHKCEKYTQAKIKAIRISKPNENYVGVIGDKTIGKIKGKTVTRTFRALPAAMVPDEVFTWTVKDEQGADVTGVTIDQNGVLSVADTAPEGKVIVKAVSDAKDEGAKNGTAEVTIGGFQSYTMAIGGPKAYDVTEESGSYILSSAIDAMGDDVSDVIDVAWSSSDEDVATIDENGELTVAGAGKTTITATITNDDKVSTATIPVTIAKYSIAAAATGDTTTVDTTDIISEGVKEYTIITSKDGAQVSSTTKAVDDMPTTKTTAVVIPEAAVKVTATYENGALVSLSTPENIPADTSVEIPPATATEKTFLWNSLSGMKPVVPEEKEIDVPGGNLEIASTGADKVEVIPVFETTTTASADTRYTFAVPKDTYNITVTMTGDRADVYVNDQMLVNNMLQYGTTPDTETRHDIYVKEGYAAINTTDYGSNASACTMSKITLSKAPSIVDRVPKIYVLGDSLVAKYYNGGSATSNVQTGWGQVLENYIKDTYEVVPLANSGVRASGLAATAITQVAESGQEGDIMILESGYNDKTENKLALFKSSMESMYTKAADKNIDVILVSPNASMHDYTASVAWTTNMAALVAQGGECYGAKYIDLSALSYEFLSTTYPGPAKIKQNVDGTDKEVDNPAAFTTQAVWEHYNVSDKLHSTYDAAQKWASIVASKMIDLGYGDIVDTTYTYTYTDTATPANTITCQAVGSAD